MRKLFGAILLVSLLAIPYLTFAQGASTVASENELRAANVADRFLERFRRTLDFGAAWKAFRLHEPSCTHRANGMLRESDYDRLRLSGALIEKLYIATMNYYYLKAANDLSLDRIDSQSQESATPREIEAAEKRSRFLQNDEDRRPQSAQEINELIGTLDQLSRLYRKYMPKRAMRSAAWKANEKYLTSRSGMDHTGIINGNETFCVPKQNRVYIVDRGIFYFYFVEEDGRMRVAGLGID